MAKVNPIELQKSLKGINYPADKQQVLQTAEQNGADEEMRSILDGLPDQEFSGPDDVSEAVGKLG